jgi:curved DNA-binding protein
MDDRWGGNLRSEIPAADTETAIALTLSEAFHGVQKRLHIDGETLTVQIPAGVKTGSRIRLKGKGRTTPFSKQRGDLYLTVELLPHPFFKVVDHDLHCEVPITPDEAALGTEIPIPTPEGRVALKIPPGVRSGQSLRLRSKGWCHPKGPRGDQLVKLQVVLPKDLSDRERECYKKLRAYRSYNPRSQLDQVTL